MPPRVRGLALVLALLVATVPACGDDGAAPPDGATVDARVIRAVCGVAGGLCQVDEACCPSSRTGELADSCQPAAVGCPVACPDGTRCEGGARCLAQDDGSYACDPCSELRSCGETLCCPLGATCDAGACLLGDLTIDVDGVRPELARRSFAAGACEISEGCVDAPGSRLLLRFELETPNVGAGDVRLGTPEEGDLFSFGACHGHFHFSSYAAYRLLDGAGVEAARGRKMAFCLLDTSRVSDDAPLTSRYDCSFQGIQRGWSDTYTRDLPCQWVDVTDVAPGDYTLELQVNPDRLLAESDYTNNVVTVPVSISPDSCPGGCTALDLGCCGEVDVCGRAGDGACDCGGLAPWDAADCASCFSVEPWCHPDTTCPGGCTAAGPGCVVVVGDGVCDCGGGPADALDCDRCWSIASTCPAITSCPGGCTPFVSDDPCCRASSANDVCGRAKDGVCDCGGLVRWDDDDCSFCPRTGC